MSGAEVTAKIEEEAEEAAAIEAPAPPASAAAGERASAVNQYMKMKELRWSYSAKRSANKSAGGIEINVRGRGSLIRKKRAD